MPTDDWWSKKPEDHLYLLSWVDCLERVDLLVLEARHLQQRIILTLREPTLYLPLAAEEEQMWGEGWSDEFESGKCNDSELAAHWVGLYPTPTEALDGYPGHAAVSGEKVINSKVKGALFDLWHGGYWSREQRRHYHTLRAVQVLKRQMILDKITLCRHGLRAKLHKPGTGNDLWSKPRFMLLRSVILARVRSYVERLADHQHAFNKASDSGPQDSPRPTLERRRELGIYGYYLADRTRDLQTHMTLLLSHLGLEYKSVPTVLHSWDDVHGSHQAYFEDEVGNRTTKVPQSLLFITTHYWMPERPDLQPIIAHELAHGVLQAQLGNLGDAGLAQGTDHFSELLVDLRDCLGAFAVRDYPEGITHLPGRFEPDYLLRELACDLLASAVKGFAYLYAMFLEIVGGGLEYAFLIGGRRFDPEMLNWLELGSGIEVGIQRRWYLRLQVVRAWLEIIHHHDLTRPDTVLLEGIRQLVEDLARYLDHLLHQSLKPVGTYWRALADELEGIIQRSTAAKMVRLWRRDRSEDEGENDVPGPRNLPRSTVRVDQRVTDFLYRLHLDAKARRGRALCETTPEERGRLFRECYGVGHTTEKRRDSGEKVFNPLYRHLFDIPWQCALMRSLDVLYWFGSGPRGDDTIGDRNELLAQLHHEFGQGRGFFSIAMEFFLHDTELPPQRLATAIHLIANFLQNPSTAATLEEELQRWLGQKQDVQYAEELAEQLEKVAKRSVAERTTALLAILDHPCFPFHYPCQHYVSAYALAGLSTPKVWVDGALARTAEHLAGLKLNKLLDCLNRASQLPDNLRPLKAYLSIRDCHTGSAPHEFYTKILEAFSPTYKKGRAFDGPITGWSPYTIARASVVTSYRSYQKEKSAAPNQKKESAETNTLSLCEMLERRSWPDGIDGFRRNPIDSDAACCSWQALLGRYDALFVTPTHGICRSPLPRFPNSGSKDDDTHLVAPLERRKFIPFFLRTEMALKVQLREPQPAQVPIGPIRPIMACISIALRSRSMRLDFVHRLLDTARATASVDIDKAQHVEDLAGRFEREDCAFLTDGWEDVMLIITGDNPRGLRLKEVFHIQRILYNDFMVDRAEAIMTPQCLTFALSRLGYDNGFRVSVAVRLIEDRVLGNVSQSFMDYVMGKAEELSKGWPKIELRRLASRMDFVLSFHEPSPDWQPTDEDTKQGLKLLFDNEWIDRLGTTISFGT